MKHFFCVMLILIGSPLWAQKKGLALHYTFQPGETVRDMTGNGYDATLQNNAYTDQMGAFTILNLGMSNGYLDLGTKTGALIGGLKDFSIATYVCVSPTANMEAHGQFLWSFGNSSNMLSDQNGCMFLTARAQRYAITRTDYRAEEAMEAGHPLAKDLWKHVVYTQSGNKATLFVDGQPVQTGNIGLTPGALGNTVFNFIGRSPYSGDAYLKALLADFRVYNRALTEKEIATLATDLPKLHDAYAAYRQKPIRHVSTANPLFSHRHTADPAALVHNGTFYIYAGEDTGRGVYYDMPNWLVFSSKDLKNWEEHPIPLRTSDFGWATGNNSWASQVIEKNGKFYWYISTEHATVPGKSIGVAVSDSPTGPFTDARGTALVTNNMTTQWTGNSWDDIDPTVWIDEDGQAYIFWGNTQCYYARLKDNMTELDGEIMPVHLPHFTEAPWIHKRGDWYYLSYATGWPEKTAYAMSKSIHGPWEPKGILNEIAGNSNTNHQAIVEFEGKWYFVYHNGAISPHGGSYLRSVCIEYLYHNEDGTIRRIQMTSEGVSPVKK